MKFCAISDQHGYLPNVPKCDALLIAGDICCHGSVHQQLNWLDTKFRKWLKSISVPVFAVAGNHDWPMYEKLKEVEKLNLSWTYLQDEFVEFNGLKIYGSPWQKRFYDWAFNLDLRDLTQKWELIPNDTDILITHSPPKFYGDLVARGTHEGCEALLRKLNQIKPKLHVFGHIHPGRGAWDYSVDDFVIKLANVSLVNERYVMVNEPMVFEIDCNRVL